MIDQIYTLLAEDSTLVSLVGKIEPKGETDSTGDCALYEYTPVSDNKTVMTARLQVTLICGKLAKALAAERRVRELLITQDDKPLTPDILQVIANGGGHLYDGGRKKHHQIVYFDIKGRSDSYGS